MAVRYLIVGKDERCRGTEDQNSTRSILPLNMFNSRKNLGHFDRTTANLRQARTRERAILAKGLLPEKAPVVKLLESMSRQCLSTWPEGGPLSKMHQTSASFALMPDQ